MASVHVGDYGGTITMTVKDRGVVKDVSAATAKVIEVRYPSDTVTSLTATFVTTGIDGKIVATMASGLLAVGGTYDARAIVTFAFSKFHSDWVTFTVKP